MNAPTRIATVKASGKRYLVQSIDFARTPAGEVNRAASKVRCWGEVASFRGLASKHYASVVFLLDAVDVAEVEKTPSLLRDLWEQGVAALRAAGAVHHVSKTGRTVYVDRTAPGYRGMFRR